jgi:hypothetical protein
MDEVFLLYYAVAVLSSSLVFIAATSIVRRLSARKFSSRLTKRNALMYALYLVNRDEGLLAVHLGIPRAELVDYLGGTQEIPIPIFREAIQLILEKTQANNGT